MIFIIYKTTNLVNGKFYIGKHNQSKESFDGYYGPINRKLKLLTKTYPIRSVIIYDQVELAEVIIQLSNQVIFNIKVL